MRSSIIYLFTEGIHDDDIDPEDLQPFPSLQQVFETVDMHTGFNIEIKYPQKKMVSHLKKECCV